MPQDTTSVSDADSHLSAASGIEIVYVTEDVRSAWMKPLTDLLTKMKDEGKFDEHMLDGYAVALFDVNLDGIPELIEAEAGGSAGNVEYIAYDLNSGERIAAFGGGTFGGQHSGAWCVYLNAETNTLALISHSSTYGGITQQFTSISELHYDESAGAYTEALLFESRYMTEEDAEESRVDAEFYHRGEAVTVADYQSEYDRFVQFHIRLPDTAMQLVRWADIEDAEEMAQALLKSDQQFVQP